MFNKNLFIMKIITAILATVTISLLSCTEKTKDSTPNAQTEIKTIQNNTPQKPLLAQLDTSNINTTTSTLYVNASSGLTLRSGTNLRSKKILTLPYGAQVSHISSPPHTTMTVAGVTGDMIEVDYQGARGFVFDGYLTQLAPPQEEESIEHYAKRISTKKHKVQVTKVKSPKGNAYGMTTTIELPAKNWTEAYQITKKLFELPQSLQLDLTGKKTSEVIANKNKREKTFKDEIAVNRSKAGEIETIIYNYQLRDYSRTVTMVKNKKGFSIKELELSK